MENNETFKMTYSAQQQEEVNQIRQKYAPKESDKMEQLRALDASVTAKATCVALVVGILGALILGVGMCFVMTDLGEILAASQGLTMLVGSAVGVVGIIMMCLAYPLYSRTLKKQREKVAPQILKLTEELMK